MTTATIRRPTQRDWPRIEEILHEVNFRVGGPEMRRFPLGDCYVAEINGTVVGVGGYRIFEDNPDTGKTTLLAVSRPWRNSNAAMALHRARIEYMFSKGVETVYTNYDNQRVIAWYCRIFGYRPTGRTIPKEESFGDDNVPEWTNLVLYKKDYKFKRSNVGAVFNRDQKTASSRNGTRAPTAVNRPAASWTMDPVPEYP